MPDPAVPRKPDVDASSAKARRRAEADADAQKKIARAARPAQRLGEPSDAPRYGETLDLFAEDAERATLQAMNTDIRQGTFEGFELPEVFLAAVESSAKRRVARPVAVAREADDAPGQGDLIADALTPASSTRSKAAVTRRASVAWIAASEPAGWLSPSRLSDEADPFRASAFSHSVDALRTVIDGQRATAAAHARHTKTMLTLTLCAMLTTLAAGIAQTVVLLRAGHEASAFPSNTDPHATPAREH
ncbi:hypothetical protein [Caballeronia sp. LZ016]|uniref:hypothetical protein n=1 Tax=Caballeronia sp. LZ016 TaxID=3038554 RepID=UPI0028623BC5|nr:hypothetical protein [Caballeronia sp. LZ016]MDR5739005.1 hypothetical protein [Caballeronia sp. LZ016]